MQTIKENRYFLIILLGLTLLSALLWSWGDFGIQHKLFADGTYTDDGALYDKIGRNIIEKGIFSDDGSTRESLIEPLYPLIIAGVYKLVGPNQDALRILNLIVFCISIILFYFLVRSLFRHEKIAKTSAIIFAFCYPLANEVGQIHREVIFIFLTLLLALFIYKSQETGKKKWFFGSGIILGLAILLNGVAQLLPLFILTWFFCFYRKQFKTLFFWKRVILFILGLLIVVSPWIMRDLFKKGKLEFVSPKGGLIFSRRVEIMNGIKNDFWSHLVGQTVGYYFVQKFDPDVDIKKLWKHPLTIDLAEKIENSKKEYGDVEIQLIKNGLKEIISNPVMLVAASLLDFIRLNSPLLPAKNFSVREASTLFVQYRWNHVPNYIKTSFLIFVRLVWLLFFALVVYGIVKSKNKLSVLAPILLLIIYFNLFYSLIHGIPRYAYPIYPFYIMFFVVGIFAFYSKFFRRDSHHTSQAELSQEMTQGSK
ncbi:glycosyltransferase family 39 protein [Patescibacteria group bacterium]|nr:glycosyltransferase family 39 protein [Patescibacteria group bacterium]MBU4458364.1 glycosyltransferase family 39 protein [Patescibacteria group bacterium]MCG2695881.1 glycosyltransferase family 39 protein [Candidatus Portnoybacteria bacterium]